VLHRIRDGGETVQWRSYAAWGGTDLCVLVALLNGDMTGDLLGAQRSGNR
jgi:hypothetical protein